MRDMKRLDEDYAILLELAPPVSTDLARQLLEAAGIPSLLHGSDFDIAELGTAAHQTLRGANVLVSKGDLERARAILIEAWGEIPKRYDPQA